MFWRICCDYGGNWCVIVWIGVVVGVYWVGCGVGIVGFFGFGGDCLDDWFDYDVFLLYWWDVGLCEWFGGLCLFDFGWWICGMVVLVCVILLWGG